MLEDGPNAVLLAVHWTNPGPAIHVKHSANNILSWPVMWACRKHRDHNWLLEDGSLLFLQIFPSLLSNKFNASIL